MSSTSTIEKVFERVQACIGGKTPTWKSYEKQLCRTPFRLTERDVGSKPAPIRCHVYVYVSTSVYVGSGCTRADACSWEGSSAPATWTPGHEADAHA